jgi:hypothetical protein
VWLADRFFVGSPMTGSIYRTSRGEDEIRALYGEALAEACPDG